MVVSKLPDLGILARITRDELVSILDALGLDADTVGTLTIRPDSIYLTGFDPATNRPTDRLIQIGEFPEPEDLPSPGPGWHVVPGCKCGHSMAHHLNALGCTWRIGRDRCLCWTYEAREAGSPPPTAPADLLHSYAAAGYTVCGLETGGGISRHDGYTGPSRKSTNRDADVTCPKCLEAGA